MEANTTRVRLLEHAIDRQSVQMWIQIERAAKNLRNPDGARRRAIDVREPLRHPRDLFGEDAIHRAEHAPLGSHQAPKLPWQRQYPLPDGHVRQDAVDNLHGLVAHSTGPATGANSAGFTGERDQHVVATASAMAA